MYQVLRTKKIDFCWITFAFGDRNKQFLGIIIANWKFSKHEYKY